MADNYSRGAESLARAFKKPPKTGTEKEQTLGERIAEELLTPEERRRRKKAKELADRYAAEQE